MTEPSAHPVWRRRALVLNATFVGAFAASATAVAVLAYLLGRLVPVAARGGQWVLAAVLLYLAACDLRLGRLITPAVRRQTRPEWRYRVGLTWATALWGLDIGSTLSTVKVTSLYWASLLLLLRVQHPPFQLAVAGFALGYLVGHLLVIGSAYRWRVARLSDLVGSAHRPAQLASAVLLTSIGVLLGVDVLLR